MKSSTVWHGHSTRPSLPAGTARKARENLLRGRRSRLITPPAKRNRAFPTGNALLYISLSYVAFGRVRLQGAPCFLCYTPDVRICVLSWEESCRFDTIPPQQFMRVKLQNNARHIPRIFPEIPAAYPDHYTSHGWTSEIRYSRMERREECTLP